MRYQSAHLPQRNDSSDLPPLPSTNLIRKNMNAYQNVFKTLFVVGALYQSVAGANSDIMAIVNGVEISKTKFEMLVTTQTSQGQPDTPEFRENLLDVMITREVLAQEALRRKLHEDPDVIQQLQATQEQLLLNALFTQIIQASEPDEKAKRAAYSKLKSARGEAKEYLTRHILVDDESTAKNIIDRISSGEPFESLASDFSIDTSTKNIGGKLDWATPERFVKEFSDAMLSLDKGQISQEPILSSFGYHIVELIDVRDASFPTYDELADEIRKDLITQTRDDLISELRNSAKIETFE